MEKSPYDHQDFYGPLQRLDKTPLQNEIKFFKHPADGSKLVRIDTFTSIEEMGQHANDMRELLINMTSNGILHVNPIFFNYTHGGSEPTLGMIVDRVPDHISCQKLLNEGNLSDDQLSELDRLLSAICNTVADAEESGGIIHQDALMPSQFVYVPENNPGERFVCVDIEPRGLERLMPGKQPRHLLTFFMELFEENIGKIKTVSPGAQKECDRAIMRMINAIPSSMANSDELKASLVEVWSTSDSNLLDRYYNENAVGEESDNTED